MIMKIMDFSNKNVDEIFDEIETIMCSFYANQIPLNDDTLMFIDGIVNNKVKIFKVKHSELELPDKGTDDYKELIRITASNSYIRSYSTKLSYYYALKSIEDLGDNIENTKFKIYLKAKKLSYLIRCGSITPYDMLDLVGIQFTNINVVWVFPTSEYASKESEYYFSYYFEISRDFINEFTEKHRKRIEKYRNSVNFG